MKTLETENREKATNLSFTLKKSEGLICIVSLQGVWSALLQGSLFYFLCFFYLKAIEGGEAISLFRGIYYLLSLLSTL